LVFTGCSDFGVDDSIYYFLRKDPENFPLYSFNALLFNLFATGLLWFLLSFYKNEIAILVGNQNLAQYLPILGYLILVTVSSMQIEGILIAGLNRFNERLILEVGTEIAKSLSTICAFYYFNSVYLVLVFFSILMSLRLISVVIIIHYCKKEKKLSYLTASTFFISQLKYGLPLGLSRVLQNILNMENFFISSFFSLVQFTYYSIGCFENPLVNAARSSMFEMVNLDLGYAIVENNKVQAIEVWRSMTRKLFLIIVPFIVYMIFFSKEIIVFVFTDKYLPSVPFFMVFNIYLFVGALSPEPFFKATSKTYLALKIKIVGLLLGISLLVGGAYLGGPIWALVGKIAGVFIMNSVGLIFAARLLDTTIFKLFQWKELAGVVLLSLIVSLFLRFVFFQVLWSPFLILSLSFSLYVSLLFVLSCWINLIKEDEIYYLKSTLVRHIYK
jgi:O-antigen/teichoic acid export membrane protein